MPKTTALHSRHLAANARMVDFAGWDMPIQYASQLEEHHAVRRAAGVFDVAHMSAVDLHGVRVREYLRRLLANDVARLETPGRALYTCMLNENGGVLDDLIVYFLAGDHFRVVVNAGTTAGDLDWLRGHASAFGVDVRHRQDLGILAVQGPRGREAAARCLPPRLAQTALALQPFSATVQGERFVARTGYTGEDGFEAILPHAELLDFWDALVGDGVTPCGLGARDTLRLEAGMNLYGQDMDETVTPLECGLGWTVSWEEERDFVGRSALQAQKAAPPRRAIGVVLDGRGVLRPHMRLRDAGGAVVGELTSGGFAPSMKASIGLARVAAVVRPQPPFEVEIRSQWLPLRMVKPPFVRHGKVLV